MILLNRWSLDIIESILLEVAGVGLLSCEVRLKHKPHQYGNLGTWSVAGEVELITRPMKTQVIHDHENRVVTSE